MRNEAIERLKSLYKVEHFRSLPNISEQCKYVPAFSDKNANSLTKCILTWLRLSGHQVERVANMGRMIDNRKIVTDCIGRQRMIGSSRWIPGTGTNGTADLHSVIKSKAVKIEIKIGRDRQSEAQKEYQRQIETAGGIYIIVRTFDEFLQWYDNFISEDVSHGR